LQSLKVGLYNFLFDRDLLRDLCAAFIFDQTLNSNQPLLPSSIPAHSLPSSLVPPKNGQLYGGVVPSAWVRGGLWSGGFDDGIGNQNDARTQ